jgi:uncharacterized iron-regulated membrane protein
MSVVGTFVRHPRKVFLRRALFQIHLWAGVLLSAYVVVIALTGSVLVFRAELLRTTLPKQVGAYVPSQMAPVKVVLHEFTRVHPGAFVSDLRMPFEASPVFVIQAQDGAKSFVEVADASTGVAYPLNKGWLDWVYDLHVYLLMSHTYGMQVNAAGAGLLLLLCVTGVVIWWPGIKVWTRGLKVAVGKNWRRVNFDLHSAIGIWTLLLVSWWALSGVYFGFYKQVVATVGWVSPLRGMVSPAVPKVNGAGRASLEQVLEAVHAASPQGRLFSISDPTLKGKTVYALVDLRAPGDFSHRDIVTVSVTEARVSTVWHYGQNKTLGDWFIWAMHPLHFGTLWGPGLKIVWAGLGLSLAVLSVTGVVMYWNRWLRHRL